MRSRTSLNLLPATPEDLPEIGDFLTELGGPLFPERFPGGTRSAFYGWKYFVNPCGPALIATARAGSGIVSIAAAVPKRVQMDGNVSVAYELGDFFTAPEWRRQGLFSRLIESLCDEARRAGGAFAYVRPNDVSFPILARHLGFEEPARFEQRRYVSPGGALERRTGVPARVWQAFGADAAARLWALGSRDHPGGIRVERVSDFRDADALWQRARAGYRFTLVRDREYLEWRYTACPTPYRIYRASRGGEPAGYIVALAYRSEPVAYLVDLFACCDDRHAVRALVGECCRDLLSGGANSIYTWTLESAAAGECHTGLRRACRFLESGGLHFAGRPLAAGAATLALPDRGWHLTIGDFDGI